jgi:hypothetical protein
LLAFSHVVKCRANAAREGHGASAARKAVRTSAGQPGSTAAKLAVTCSGTRRRWR